MADNHPERRRRKGPHSLSGDLAHVAWRRENRAAIKAHNRRVERDGVLLTPPWAAETSAR